MLHIIRRNQDLLSDFFNGFDDFNNRPSLMKTDIMELENEYKLIAELPGYNKDDIKISIDNKYLIIEASKEEVKEDTKYLRKERYYGNIKRSFYVGNLSIDEVKGEFNSGILTLIIPKESQNVPETKYLNL